MKLHKFSAAVGTALAVLAPALTVLATPSAQAQTYSVLYSFHNKHGRLPVAGLIQDKKRNLYGTAQAGGSGYYCCGVVFKLTASGKEKVLYSFTGGTDGAHPQAGLVRDSSGNLYGTTESGGAYDYGVVFMLDTTGAETVLHSFGGADGASPVAGLVRDKSGTLYGTTAHGGSDVVCDNEGDVGCGTVFKVDTSGNEAVLYRFTGGTDGSTPEAGLVRDSIGNLYGTTQYGGAYGAGVVFKLKANGKEKVLYSFTGGADGSYPMAGLVRDKAGNLYGTTEQGGTGWGVVFKLDTTGTETVLHSFSHADGSGPVRGLVLDSVGNLYGTTQYGGAYNWGVVFKLDTTGTETVLHSFSRADGACPYGDLLRDSAGNLYGTTLTGGPAGDGVAFKITPQ